jgi:hypothetical protein
MKEKDRSVPGNNDTWESCRGGGGVQGSLGKGLSEA